MAERVIEVDGAGLCAEDFGDPADPPLLLIMGTGASMLWWEEAFCRMLADGGRFVIRYDHRDTGRSTTYPVGSPGYTGADLFGDAIRVLDGYDIGAAHLVGVSAGAGCAQEIALERPERVRTMVLISTTFATGAGRDLPPPTAAFNRFVATAEVDWSDPGSILEYMVGYQRVLSGVERPFDEAATRELVRRDIERARDYPAIQNHDLLAGDAGADAPVSAIAAPTLVVHGTADPMFPPEHGTALAAEIPGARLVTLDGAGHGVYREDWETLVAAILEHSAGSID